MSAASPAAQPAFTVRPEAPLMDDRLAIALSGLPSGRRITVRASSRARNGRWWRSEAHFESGPEGAIDLAQQAPVAGTYSGADAMGLFWSMRPEEGNGAFFIPESWAAPVATLLEAFDGGRRIAAATIERRFARPEVRRTVLKAESGLAGVLFEPGDGAPHPGVIVLGGAEGSCGAPEDALLAGRGFMVLSLAYFGVPATPATLRNIPLEYFGRAIEWMGAHPSVAAGGIALMGFSRGAEAALLAGSANAGVRAVVALAPTGARWAGLTARRWPRGAAWTEGGRPLPCNPIRIGPRFAMAYVASRLARRPVATASLFGVSAPDAEIAVERIRGPVLLVSGGDDRVWPSATMADRVLARLRRHRHPYPDEHLHFPDAGHWLPRAWVPMAGSRARLRWAIGGTPEGTACAFAAAWPRILALLAGRSGC